MTRREHEVPPQVVAEVRSHLLKHLFGAPTVTAPEGVGFDWWQTEITKAVNACDQEHTDALVIGATLNGAPEGLVRHWFVEAVTAASHDVQMYWKGTCNCDGHLN